MWWHESQKLEALEPSAAKSEACSCDEIVVKGIAHFEFPVQP